LLQIKSETAAVVIMRNVAYLKPCESLGEQAATKGNQPVRAIIKG
jgi:hypothetical protein